MTDILECAAALLWIALAIYTFREIRRLNRRVDDALDELDATFEQWKGDGPW